MFSPKLAKNIEIKFKFWKTCYLPAYINNQYFAKLYNNIMGKKIIKSNDKQPNILFIKGAPKSYYRQAVQVDFHSKRDQKFIRK